MKCNLGMLSGGRAAPPPGGAPPPVLEPPGCFPGSNNGAENWGGYRLSRQRDLGGRSLRAQQGERSLGSSGDSGDPERLKQRGGERGGCRDARGARPEGHVRRSRVTQCLRQQGSLLPTRCGQALCVPPPGTPVAALEGFSWPPHT